MRRQRSSTEMGGSQSRSRARDEGPPKHGKTAPRSMGPQTGASGHTAAPAPGPRGAARAGTGSRVDQLKKKAPPPGGCLCASRRAVGRGSRALDRARARSSLATACTARSWPSPRAKGACARACAPLTCAALGMHGWSRRMAALSDFRSPGQVRTPVASSSSYYSQNLASALSFDPRSPGMPSALSPSPVSSSPLPRPARSRALWLRKLTLAPAGCGRTDADSTQRSGKGVGHRRKGALPRHLHLSMRASRTCCAHVRRERSVYLHAYTHTHTHTHTHTLHISHILHIIQTLNPKP